MQAEGILKFRGLVRSAGGIGLYLTKPFFKYESAPAWPERSQRSPP